MILPYKNKQPLIEESAYVSSSATVIGDVTLEKGGSARFHSVVRDDKGHIHIGEDSSVQDNCTLHTDPERLLQAGKQVIVGHSAVLHGCMIEDEVLVNMEAIVLDDARIGRHSIIGAGVLIKEGQQIPRNSLAVGSPARIMRKYNGEQVEEVLENATHYAQLGSEYKEVDV